MRKLIAAAAATILAASGMWAATAQAGTVDGFGQWYCTALPDGTVNVTAFPYLPTVDANARVWVVLSERDTGRTLKVATANVSADHTVQIDYRPDGAWVVGYRVEVRTLAGKVLQRNGTYLACASQR